jgi:hypothetical protein
MPRSSVSPAGLHSPRLERGDRLAMLVGNRPEFVFVLSRRSASG